MLPLLIILIALGIILETISLKRDPEKVDLDYVISTGVTEPGAPFHVQTVITNKSRMPVSYMVVREILPEMTELSDDATFQTKHDGLHVKNVCRVKGRQRKKLTLETSINKRGVHLFRGASIEFGDFLGFREISKKVTNQQEIIVYPERLENPGLIDALASFCGDIAAQRYLIRDPILSAGCREYTGREPMKDIHWLQSARRGELMVREFEYNRQVSVNVILDVGGVSLQDDDRLDKCCAAARTICEKLVEKSVPVSFFTNAVLWRKGNKEAWRCEVSSGHTGGLLEGLGRVSSHACGSLEKLLEYAIHENDSAASFIVIVPEGGKYERDTIERFRRITGQEVLLVQMETEDAA